MGGVVIEQNADHHANWIGRIEGLEKGHEFPTAMTLGDGMMNGAGHEIGCRADGDGAKTFIFMVALESGMVPWPRRQIGAVVAIAWMPSFSS